MLETVSVPRSHIPQQQQQQYQTTTRKQLAISTDFGSHHHHHHQEEARVEIAPNSPYSRDIDHRYPIQLGQLLEANNPDYMMPGHLNGPNGKNNRIPPMPYGLPSSPDRYNSSPSNSSTTTPDTSLTEIHHPRSHLPNHSPYPPHPSHPHDMVSPGSFRNTRTRSAGDMTSHNSSDGSRQSSRVTLSRRESILGTSPPVQPYFQHPGVPNINRKISLQQKTFDPAFNKHTSLSAAAGTAGPTASAGTPRDQKRRSRFGFFKRGSGSSSGSSGLPNISEPVLESSTSELVLDGRRSMSIGPRQSSLLVTAVNGIGPTPGLSARFSNGLRPRPQTPPTRSEPPPLIQESNHERTSSEESARDQVERFEREIIDRNSRIFSGSSLAAVAPDRQMSFADRLDREIHESTNKNHNNNVIQKRSSTPAVVSTAGMSELITPEEIVELKRKLKEADDKRRLVIIEYQQKLDSERKKTVELQKKLDNLNKYVNEKKALNDTNSAKIKSLESQRDVLRQALITLKETKDMKINEYKSQLEKSRVTRYSMMPAVGGSQTSTITSQNNQSPSPNPQKPSSFDGSLRIGLGPLLPISTAVDMKS